MLLVIFGAGASHDSSAVHPASGDRPPGIRVMGMTGPRVLGRPPLADHLFQPAYTQRNPGDVERAQLIISRMQALPGSVEERLQHYQTRAQGSPWYRGQIQALRFYLHRTIASCEHEWRAVTKGGLTNYATLIGAIEESAHPEVCLVTFNYDTLLEDALRTSLGIHLSKSEDYLAHARYRLIKLHGCLTWSHPVLSPVGDYDSNSVDALVSRVIEAAAIENLKLGPLLIGTRPFQTDPKGRPLVPALALPVEPKSEFVCPDEHQRQLIEFLPSVTKVLIVGWKAAEQSFLHLLAQHLPADVTSLVVAGSQEEAQEKIIPVLQAAGIRGTFNAATGGFTTSLCISGEIDTFLEV
jgi:hypothetical protein